MKTILVPVDFSKATLPTLETAVKLAKSCSGEILLFHAMMGPLDYRAYPAADHGLFDAETARALRELDGLLSLVRSKGVAARTKAVVGEPVTNILSEAKDCGADVIVMGSHGHTAIYDLLIGSTSSGVIQGAPCPVMIAPVGQNSRQERKAAPALSLGAN